MYHSLLTLIFILFSFFLNLPMLVYFYPVCFYLGRELTQSEYRYIQANGGKRSNCPWYCGLIPSAGTVKSFFDWFLPFITAILCILIQKYFSSFENYKINLQF